MFKNANRLTVIIGGCLLLLAGMNAKAQYQTKKVPVYYEKYGQGTVEVVSATPFKCGVSMYSSNQIHYGEERVLDGKIKLVLWERAYTGAHPIYQLAEKYEWRQMEISLDELALDPRLTYGWFRALFLRTKPVNVRSFLLFALNAGTYEDEFELDYLTKEIEKMSGDDAYEKVKNYTEELVPMAAWQTATSVLCDYRQKGEIEHHKEKVEKHYLNLPVKAVVRQPVVRPPSQPATPKSDLEQRVEQLEQRVDSLKQK